MTRVGQVEESAFAGDLADPSRKFTETYGDFTNQVKVLAHSPQAFRHLYGLIDAWRTEGSLPQRLVEIAVVTTSKVNACPYCVGHHGTALVDLGLAPETVERILEPEAPGLDERDRAVRDYARLVTERAWGIGDSVFDALRRHFSDRQIVELTVRIGLCSLFNKLNQALEVEIEDAVLAQMAAGGISAEARPTASGLETTEPGDARPGEQP